MTAARIVLLTGPIGVGKTTAAGRVASLARQQGLACGGLLAPAMLDAEGIKIGIWGVDLLSGEHRPLALIHRPPDGAGQAPGDPGTAPGERLLGGMSVGPYSFDAGALAWGVRAVETAAATCDLTIVDEIGKLELWQGTGLAPVLPWLAAGQGKSWLVLVRDFLLDELRARLSPLPHAVWDVSATQRDELPALIVAHIVGHIHTQQEDL